jgi:hypothetical protein
LDCLFGYLTFVLDTNVADAPRSCDFSVIGGTIKVGAQTSERKSTYVEYSVGINVTKGNDR